MFGFESIKKFFSKKDKEDPKKPQKKESAFKDLAEDVAEEAVEGVVDKMLSKSAPKSNSDLGWFAFLDFSFFDSSSNSGSDSEWFDGLGDFLD